MSLFFRLGLGWDTSPPVTVVSSFVAMRAMILSYFYVYRKGEDVGTDYSFWAYYNNGLDIGFHFFY